ncbi:ABC transporter permease [Streptomyces endophytica]|uniref:ABC transporter permease n=1 Tax=Streptomyces endophytica TaxID=2991496 RepID=A0ABY6P9K5_9ACTN|nr:ABC transporter permease [Streptomyces endophytica]UZJ30486.1 ABC transporter permease [Streptomyces endophytica]
MSTVRRPDHHRSAPHGGHRAAPAGRPAAHAAGLRHVLAHLVTPLLMCIGMGLAYLGAFAHPAPHHLPVAVVGSSRGAQLLAQSLNDTSGGDLEVRTVPDRPTAVEQLKHQDIFGAYVMHAKAHAQAQPQEGAQGGTPKGTQGPAQGRIPEGTQGRTQGPVAPELLVATAGSDTSASVVQKIFTPLAAQQGAPLKVTDVAPPAEDDPTGQGIFFLLVAISIGSYASVAVIGGAGAVLPLRLRAALAIGTSAVVSLIGTAFAGPVFHLVDHGLWGLWGMAWLYSAGVLLIGTGLHTFLKRWTTLGVMALFVMLNFTSSGGIFRPEMQNGFFAALHSFWNGAGFVEGLRSHVYFHGYGLSGHVWTLVGWLLVGVLMVGLAGLAERRRRAAEAEAAANAAAVAAAAVAATVPEPRPRRLVRAAAPGTGSSDEATKEELTEEEMAEEEMAEEELEEVVGV